MLDKTTYKLLKEFYKYTNLKFSLVQEITKEDERKAASKYVSSLMRYGFIEKWSPENVVSEYGEVQYIGYSITLSGCAYVEQRRRDGLNFWVPYTITTLIAIMSLLMSLSGRC